MNVVHPKVKVPFAVLTALTGICALLTGVAGVHQVPWAATIAAGLAAILQIVIGYMVPSGAGTAPVAR